MENDFRAPPPLPLYWDHAAVADLVEAGEATACPNCGLAWQSAILLPCDCDGPQEPR